MLKINYVYPDGRVYVQSKKLIDQEIYDTQVAPLRNELYRVECKIAEKKKKVPVELLEMQSELKRKIKEIIECSSIDQIITTESPTIHDWKEDGWFKYSGKKICQIIIEGS